MPSISYPLLVSTLLLAPGTSSLQPRVATPPPPPPFPSNSGASRQPVSLRQRLALLGRKPRGGGINLKAVSINSRQDEQQWLQQQPPSRVPKDTSITNNPTIPTVPPLQGPFETTRKRTSLLSWMKRYLVPSRQLIPEVAAEAFGTFLLLQMALGIVLSANFVPGALQGLFPIALLTGMAITASCAAVSSKCAAHFNPAITLAMCLYRNFGWTKFVPYLLAQLVGATGAALVNFVLYAPLIAQFEASQGLVRSTVDGLTTAKTMACYSSAPALTAFLAESLGTFALTSVVFALTSDRNKQAQGLFIPPIIGSTVALIITVIGPLSGASLNPARELGPRLILKLFGWSSSVAFGQLGLYVTSALLGATAGGFLVDKFLYAKDDSEEDKMLQPQQQISSSSSSAAYSQLS